MHGAREGASQEDFKAPLAQEGIDTPKNAAKAQATAAQNAAKAHVYLRATRDPIMPRIAQAAPVAPLPTPGRLMALREGPAAARAFVTPAGQGPIANSLSSLRTAHNFEPGSMRKTHLSQAVPAVARTTPDAKATGLAERMVAKKAAHACAAGATAQKPAPATTQDPPEWFAGAMQDGLAKYEAMKAQR